ncbi:uncharacterized protein C3orf38 [Phlebotomus argentipes]|uniref:uncharacterized protein C3orf38 n=1 Tax=Phlebotomus argentipes TaxID=94469 RepID=UPI00289312C6|nr:uncharacterized protein C3orf38 [Phlebotomus argentipes]
MSRLNDWEIAGLKDFLTFDVRTEAFAIDVAKSLLSKVSVNTPKSSADAIDTIIQNCDSALMILDKKAMTKDILSTYLMDRGNSFSVNATKQILVQQVIQHWQRKFQTSDRPHVIAGSSIILVKPENFQVNTLSRQFTSWFYQKLNEDALTLADFWPDVSCAIRFTQSDSVTDESAEGSEAVLEKLLTTRRTYNFNFNPNISSSGVQGRIDLHGLVFVISCGTLHIANRWVGVFESAFGLVQDPAGLNNWKCKHIKIALRSTQKESLPTLQDCESIRDIIALPVTSEDLPN